MPRAVCRAVPPVPRAVPCQLLRCVTRAKELVRDPDPPARSPARGHHRAEPPLCRGRGAARDCGADGSPGGRAWAQAARRRPGRACARACPTSRRQVHTASQKGTTTGGIATQARGTALPSGSCTWSWNTRRDPALILPALSDVCVVSRQCIAACMWHHRESLCWTWRYLEARMHVPRAAGVGQVPAGCPGASARCCGAQSACPDGPRTRSAEMHMGGRA